MPALLRPSGPVDGITPSPRSQPPGPFGLWLVFYGDRFLGRIRLCRNPRTDAAANNIDLFHRFAHDDG